MLDHRYRWSYRKYGSDRYYGRWGDEQEDPQQHYLTTKPRNWKQRPSSASEMDRKSGENKNWPGKHYFEMSKSESTPSKTQTTPYLVGSVSFP